MRTPFLQIIFFACLAFLVSVLPTAGQNPQSLDLDSTDAPNKTPKRPVLSRELELTSAQLRQVRELNQEIKPERQAAQRRLKAARESFDAAIYSEQNNEAEIQLRVRELQAARLEILKNRVRYEQSLKRILTAQQLAKFRRLQREYNLPKSSDQNAARQSRSPQNQNLTPRQQRRLNRLENRQKRQQKP